MQSEMSIYRRLLAAYRLPSGKHVSILTDFQTKINKKKAKTSFFRPACPPPNNQSFAINNQLKSHEPWAGFAAARQLAECPSGLLF